MEVNSLSNSIGIGKAKWVNNSFKKSLKSFSQKSLLSVDQELLRLNCSVSKSMAQIKKEISNLKKQNREVEAEILETHELMISDPELMGQANNLISTEYYTAEFALSKTIDMFVSSLQASENEYFKTRIHDLEAVKELLLKNLNVEEVEEVNHLDHSRDLENEKIILMGRDISIRDLSQISEKKLQGMLTQVGGKTAHNAIVARSLNIAALLVPDLPNLGIKDGDNLIVDGLRGKLIINPDQGELNSYLEEVQKLKDEFEKIKQFRGKKSLTKNGKAFPILANMGAMCELDSVIDNDAEGIGLLRSEFLFLDREDIPSEEEQVNFYTQVLKKLSPRPVTIRTLDIGADKPVPGLKLKQELNPFLGLRGLRLCLKNLPLFKTQLRALYRSSVHGNLQIMLPMVSDVQEIKDTKKVISEVLKELEKENILFNKNVPLGIMVEIPSAALEAQQLAKHVDFMSIGTNDLTQYTLACDRLNEQVSYLYQSTHPAVLKLIALTVEGARKSGISVSVCGEMANIPENLEVLLKLGIDKISVSSHRILSLRSELSHINFPS